MTDQIQDSAILGAFELGFPWQTFDPFLFCVHHDDAYPAGTPTLGPPKETLKGRNIGMDFELREGWRMYHGDVVPGFPRHPHRGFETVTLARHGYIDHSDSTGAKARFGHGDCQWMTAGKGVVHSEMFPLLDQDGDNRGELFQIWLNLPAEDKMVEPYFTMLWSEGIPRPQVAEGVELEVVAGPLPERVEVPAGTPKAPPAPPPNSWAARPEAEVAIWTIRMEPGSRWTLPAASPGLNRTLYFFLGESVALGGQLLDRHAGVRLRSDQSVELEASSEGRVELLMLQGRPIGEPVAHHGPFVMNTQAELRQAFIDYRSTGFGGWPWAEDGPVHGPTPGRFAVHSDGREETHEAAE
ncbi:pirin family protein [Plesiocystis pacifica SIR-1]|uniref:Pirin family protein n=1 Tax=Plesiocystis pacifica SIR-1 TaxID=391625 RepID=A6G8C4_9BACT|nr:pirin family protein [Plesiocystis pacifica]EDM77834.1 pirin family protein [Plesiocystis pacifica SIR-1]